MIPNKRLRQMITMATNKGLQAIEAINEPISRQGAEEALFSALAEVQRIFDVLHLHEKEKILKAIEELERATNDYVLENGKPIAIIWRKKGADLTAKCPFCDKKHSHGTDEGLRIPHCLPDSKKFKNIILQPDGTRCFWDDGYYLMER